MISPALIRYRARVSERRFLLDELRKRREQLGQLVGEFSAVDTAEAHWRLRRFRDECSRCIDLLERLPEPRKPTRRMRKARVLRLLKGASS